MSPSRCFYYDTDNQLFVPLLTWVNAVGWASEFSGGSQHPGIIHQFPPGYFEGLWQIFKRLVNNPNQDTFPDFFMKPTTDYVVIKTLPPETTTPGGIIIPVSAKQNGLLGEVLFVGPGVYNPATGGREPMDSKVGQKVMFDKFAGTDLLVEGMPCLIMREKSILLHF